MIVFGRGEVVLRGEIPGPPPSYETLSLTFGVHRFWFCVLCLCVNPPPARMRSEGWGACFCISTSTSASLHLHLHVSASLHPGAPAVCPSSLSNGFLRNRGSSERYDVYRMCRRENILERRPGELMASECAFIRDRGRSLLADHGRDGKVITEPVHSIPLNLLVCL